MSDNESFELANAGILSAAINLGNIVLARTEADGRPAGITVELAEKIACALNLSLSLKTYPTAGKVVDDAADNTWDVAFLAIDPMRDELLSFTAPYITIQGTLLVKIASPWHSVKEMDRVGMTINVGKGAAYDLFLSRTLKKATLSRFPSSQHAVDAFINGEGDMVAGVRQPLEQAMKQHGGFRVVNDNFTQIHQAVCVPKTKTALYARVYEMVQQWQADGSLNAIVEANRIQDQ